jgi:hypothetical protein
MTVQSLTQIAAEAHRNDMHLAAERRRTHAAPRAGAGRSRPRLEFGALRLLRQRPA